jgi:arylformamidase
VDELPLDVLIGPAWVAHIPGTQTISAANLDAASIPADITRLLIRTDNSARATASLFATMEFAALATDAKDWLLDRRVRLVGIDGPSVELPISPEAPVHRALLGAGVIVVEGLDLAEVAPGTCQLICLPLRIAAGDGSPARVVLVRDV